MDKILSAEEWIQRKNDKDCIVKNDDKIRFAQSYSTYLLEAFAGEVKKEYYEQEGETVDQLLTKFKEKL